MSVANYALCTLDEVKDFYGMSGSVQEDDDLIEDNINRISKAFANECGVSQFKLATYTEYYDGPGGKFLFLKHTPVVSVTSIYEDSGWDWTSEYLKTSTDYRIVDNKYIVAQGSFISGDQAIKITYRAGFSEIPEDLKLVCIEEVIRRYKHRKDFDVIRKTLNDGTSEYVMEPWLSSTVQILSKYKSGYLE